MHRRCRGSHISRAPFAPLGSGAHSAPAWVGWLLANFITGSALLVFCSRVRAAAKHSVLTTNLLQKEKPVFKERVRPPSRLLLSKKLLWTARRKASYAQRLSAGKKANFGCGQKFAFLHNRTTHLIGQGTKNLF